jgi:hypothetical protein
VKLTADLAPALSARLQFLAGLCTLSMQSVNGSIRQFLSSTFITNELQRPLEFDKYIDTLVQQSKSNAPAWFARLVSSISAINHGNAITYEDECSCALHTNCTRSADIIPIRGLNMGCTATSSFLVSTLECFYNLSCINLINGVNTTDTPLLFANSSRFPPSTLITDLIDHLFVETWSTTINYSAYFILCSPISCSYTYVQQLNSFYLMTVILGLSGGLNVVLQGICPTMIYLLFKVYQCRKKRLNLVDAERTIDMATIETEGAAVATMHVPRSSTSSEAFYRYPRATFRPSLLVALAVLMLVAAMFVGPFVYLRLQRTRDTHSALINGSHHISC